MPSYLVTFCNTGQASFALIGEGGAVHAMALDLGDRPRPVSGTVGATFAQGRCFIATQSDPPAVAVYREDWTLERTIAPEEVRDIHGIAVLGDELLIVSTGTSQIVACDLHSLRVRPFWSEGGSLSDTVHVNDVFATGDRAVACRFGQRDAAGQRGGAVFDAGSGEVLVRHLREPHSVVMDDDATIYVAESPAGDVLRCRPGFSPRRDTGIVGYARGLAVGETEMAIGKSGYRQQSRSGIGDSRHPPHAPNEAAREANARSGIFVVNRSDGAARFIDTTAVGPEVYAVVACPFPVPSAAGKRPGRGIRTGRRRR